jgi:hypothetical protein
VWGNDYTSTDVTILPFWIMLQGTKVKLVVTVSLLVINLHSYSDYTASNDWIMVNNELERIQKEAVGALMDKEKS